MKKIITVFAIICLLQGCIPAAFVTGAAIGGAVVYDHRSSKVMVADRNATFQIQSQLKGDRELRENAHISIATFNRIAVLVGQAPTEEMRNKAELIAKANPKIRMLYNEITIGAPTSASQRTNDTWITTKIKTMLLAASGLNSTNLKVVTENGVVYLMGLTTRTQAQIAVNKARTASGVKKVVKLFEYLN